MNNKTIMTGIDVQKELIEGVNILASVVKPTLGPRGQNVIIERKYRTPLVTNDGVSIAKEVFLADRMKNMGVQLMKEVASKTNDLAGDGTTTATVLAQAIATEGHKIVTSGRNAILLRTGMLQQLDKIIEDIESFSTPVTDREQYIDVAHVSSGSKAIGELVADAVMAVGPKGIINIENSPNTKTMLNVVEGYRIESGLSSPYFLTDPQRMISETHSPCVLVTTSPIRNPEDIAHILQSMKENNLLRPLMICAPSYEIEVVSMLAANHMANGMVFVPITIGGVGSMQKSALEDIAAYTGATVIDEEKGGKLSEVAQHLDYLGTADTVKSDRLKTDIIRIEQAKQCQDQIMKIESMLEEARGQEEKTFKDRIAKLNGKASVIRVGAQTQAALEESKLRVEDAVNAAKAAGEEGIVPGGGTVFAILYGLFNEDDYSDELPEVVEGRKIVMNALAEPLKVIATNSGQSADVILNEVLCRNELVMSPESMVGYDAYYDEYIPMMSRGITDPTKVTKSAIKSATSVVSTMLTSQGIIAFEENEEKEPQSMLG